MRNIHQWGLCCWCQPLSHTCTCSSTWLTSLLLLAQDTYNRLEETGRTTYYGHPGTTYVDELYTYVVNKIQPAMLHLEVLHGQFQEVAISAQMIVPLWRWLDSDSDVTFNCPAPLISTLIDVFCSTILFISSYYHIIILSFYHFIIHYFVTLLFRTGFSTHCSGFRPWSGL